MALRWLLCLCVLMLAGVEPGRAHVGSPDVYVKATAGPYQLLVSVHPPARLPGAAGVDVRTDDADVSVILVSLPEGPPEPLQRFSTEQLFTGSVWLRSGGSWKAVIHVHGARGDAETTVPIPALSDKATGIRRFNRPQWWVLGGVVLMCVALLLFRQSRAVMVAGFVVVGVIFGAAIVVASRTSTLVTPEMKVSMVGQGKLQIALPGRMDDLVDDHNHRMHLFAIREPEMDVVLHLHPAVIAPGRFEATLPSMAPGAFVLFADVVHRDGQLETFMASAGLPGQTGHVLAGDDSVGVVPPLSRAEVLSGPGTQTIRLMDEYSMKLDLPTALHPRSGQLLRVALLDPAGGPPADMQLYMGMQAHAVVLKSDGTVFAHIHPTGTIPMGASGMGQTGTDMAGMDMAPAPASGVSFPFGFPSAGRYRMFVQMKHGGIIETGAFDLQVR
jgi:hypothetical protein